MDYKQILLGKIADRSAIVAVAGLGYVGLPLAVEFASAGFQVLGVDVDQDKVRTLNAGGSYIDDVPPDSVSRLVDAGRLRATCDYNDLRVADAISICVPTPLRKTRDPDMSYISQAAGINRRDLPTGHAYRLGEHDLSWNNRRDRTAGDYPRSAQSR